MKNNKTAWKLVLLSLTAALLMSGCKTLSDADVLYQTYEFRRGIVSLYNDKLMFTPCFEQQVEAIHDLTGRLQARLQKSRQPVVYTEISGSLSGEGTAWQAHKVHLIGGGKITCSYELEGNEFRAAGEKPVWIADIRKDSIHVQDFQKLTKLKFNGVEAVNTPDGLEWSSSIAGNAEHQFTLKLSRSLCKDSHDTEYEYTAEMRLDGRLFDGCARKGNLDLISLPGIYKADMPAVGGVTASLSMVLTSAGDVRLIQNYDNDQPVIVHKGTWQRMPKKKLVVYLTNVTGNQENEVLLFQRNQSGALELKGFSSLYGDKGLKFYRTGFVSAITEPSQTN